MSEGRKDRCSRETDLVAPTLHHTRCYDAVLRRALQNSVEVGDEVRANKTTVGESGGSYDVSHLHWGIEKRIRGSGGTYESCPEDSLKYLVG